MLSDVVRGISRDVVRLVIHGQEPGVSGDVTTTFGNLTREAAGGVAVTGTSISSGDASGHWQVSGGLISPSAAGETASLNLGPYSLTLDDGQTVAITIEADTYSWRPSSLTAGELSDIIALGVATLSGKTAKARGGDQLWVSSTLNSRSFTSEFTIASHDNSDRVNFIADDTDEIRDPTNLKFYQCDFTWSFVIGSSNSAGAAITMKGNIDNFTVEDCTADGGLSTVIDAEGQPFFGSEWSYRGFFGLDGTSDVIGPLTIKDNIVHDFWRAFNIPGGAGVLTFDNNDIYNCSVDSGVFAGACPNGRFIRWNRFRDPLVVVPPEVAVTSVDVAANRMTASSDRFGSSGTVSINISASTTTPPGGTNYPGVGGGNDYSCTIISVSGGETVLEFPVDITDAGTNVFINVEPDHADLAQGIPGDGADVNNIEFIGNRGFGAEGADGSWPQVWFFEDIAGPGVPGYYDDCIFAGNIGYSGSPQGLWNYNMRRGVVAYNTNVSPSDTSVSLQASILQTTQFGYDGEQNVMFDNAAKTVSSVVGSDVVEGNHELSPADYASSGIFTGTGGYAPTTLDEMTDAFERQDINGVIDYAARTYDLPAINTATLPAFVDQADVAQSTLITSAPVQVTGINNSEGVASSYGAFGDGPRGLSPEFRITSDAGGATVVTDWGSTPSVIDESQYLWLRDTSTSSPSTARNIFARVGRSTDTWTVTTAAGAATESFVIFDSSDSLDMNAEGLATSGSGFIIAGKMKAPATLATTYLAANVLDTYVRILNSGALGVRVEDTTGSALATADTGATTLLANDEFSFIFAANQSGCKLRLGINTDADATLINETYTTANNLDIPQYMNAVNGSGGLAATFETDVLWAAGQYLDPDTVWSSFFDADNDPTTDMRDGNAISSVTPDFSEGGNAADWNALTGMNGTVTDA